MRTPDANAPWQMQPGAAPGPPPPPPHALCAQCERIVGGMQAAAAAANSTYGAVVKDFFDTKVCPNLPPDAQTPCTHYIDTEMPALWAEIVDDLLDPETACTSMHMCSAAARASGAEANPLECKLCKQAAKFLDKKIFEDPEVDAEVATRLADVCKVIPQLTKPEEKKCEVRVRANASKRRRKHVCLRVCKCTDECVSLGSARGLNTERRHHTHRSPS